MSMTGFRFQNTHGLLIAFYRAHHVFYPFGLSWFSTDILKSMRIWGTHASADAASWGKKRSRPLCLAAGSKWKMSVVGNSKLPQTGLLPTGKLSEGLWICPLTASSRSHRESNRTPNNLVHVKIVFLNEKFPAKPGHWANSLLNMKNAAKHHFFIFNWR